MMNDAAKNTKYYHLPDSTTFGSIMEHETLIEMNISVHSIHYDCPLSSSLCWYDRLLIIMLI